MLELKFSKCLFWKGAQAMNVKNLIQSSSLIVQVSGQNSPIYSHKNNLWAFKFDNNDYHGHSQAQAQAQALD